MNWIEALILGIVQGLTEFLPVSSSGHLEIGKHLLGADVTQSLEFTVVVHGATVLSTVVVFWKDIVSLFKSFFTFKNNEETSFVWKIVISMVPVGIIGILFKDEVEQFFNGNLHFVGAMLIVTAVLLAVTMFVKNRGKHISYLDSFIIGIAQAVAVLPGISRSGATIATGLLLGNKKEEVAKFSFLMVIIPILGANLKELFSGEFGNNQDISAMVLVVGFIAAFISGLFACRWMINIVKRGNLYYFALYCLIIGSIALIFG